MWQALQQALGGGGGEGVNLSIASRGIARWTIMAMVSSQAGQVRKFRWLANNDLAKGF